MLGEIDVRICWYRWCWDEVAGEAGDGDGMITSRSFRPLLMVESRLVVVVVTEEVFCEVDEVDEVAESLPLVFLVVRFGLRLSELSVFVFIRSNRFLKINI